MTKLKSKKMTKSTFAVIIMAIAMVAMLAFGGTYAYFTASAETMTSREFEVGKVLLADNSAVEIKAAGTIVPGDTLIDGNITYTNTSTVDTCVAVVVSFAIDGTAATADQVTALGVTFTVDATNTWEIVADGNNQVYLAKGTGYKVASTTGSLAFTTADVTFEAKEHSTNGTLPTDSVQGKKITMSIKAYQTQADYVVTESTTTANAVWTAMKAALADNSITA